MKEIIISIILFLVSLSAVILSVRSFLQRGFLFNNSYLYASESERQALDKKPLYVQTGVVFLFIAAIFLLNGLQVLLEAQWLFYCVLGLVAAAIVYVIASTVIINRSKK